MAPGVQAADARGFLENAATLRRLGVDDVADAPLAHERRGMRAGGEIGEQILHVAGAHFPPIDAICRARAAFDAARHFDLFILVEGGGRVAVGIVEHQCDLGHIARRARIRTVEDDVFHATAAHLAWRGFAHHPAHRFDNVRLAAAVRSDDARGAGLDCQFAGFDEGLEADQFELRKMQGLCVPLSG